MPPINSADANPVTPAEILIIEDSPADLRLLTQMLGHAGFSIRMAQTGQTALQSVSLQQPDLILLDITLPDVSGYEVCSQLKAQDIAAEVPIIFLSGRAQATDKVKAFESGGTDYITKPYQAEELLARITCHLKHRRTQQVLLQQYQQLRQQDEVIRTNLQQVRTIAHITDQIHRSLDTDKIFEVTTQLLREALKCDRIVIYRLNPDWTGRIVAESVDMSAVSALTIWPQSMPTAETGPGAVLKAIIDEVAQTPNYASPPGSTTRSDYGRSVEDTGQIDLAAAYQQFLEQLSVKAYRIVPIYVGNGFWGALGVYQHHSPRPWRDVDITILAETAFQLGIALEQVQLLTQIQQKSTELAQAQATAEAAIKTQSAFLANMSHELRTPLNAILGYAQVMQRDSALTPPYRSKMEAILCNGTQLLTLIDHVLELAQIEAGHLEPYLEQFALVDLMQSLYQIYQPQAKTKGLDLKLELAADLPGRIEADLGKLRQVLANLLENAINLTQKGGVILRAWTDSVSVVPDGEPTLQQLNFSVADTAASRLANEFSTEFAPFDSALALSAKRGGAGLGLVIGKQLVEFLGGQLTFGRMPGEGNCIELTVPVHKVAIPTETANSDIQSPAQVIGLAPNHTRQRVLVVDDTYINRRVVTRLLQTTQFEVAEAEDGEAAVRAWQTLQPQLILMDIQMPTLNGYDAVRTIRQREKEAAAQQEDLRPSSLTKIIAITAATLDTERQAAIAAGCDAVLTKPIRADQLYTKIGVLLNIPCQYESVSLPAAAPCQPPITAADLTAADFAAVSESWLQQAHHTAVFCDDTQLLQLVKQLPEEASRLKRVLCQYIHALQLTPLIACLEHHLPPEKST